MNFKSFYHEKIISPFVQRTMPRNAINTGPDAGMTSNMINNTFPSAIKMLPIKLPQKKKIKKKKD